MGVLCQISWMDNRRDFQVGFQVTGAGGLRLLLFLTIQSYFSFILKKVNWREILNFPFITEL